MSSSAVVAGLEAVLDGAVSDSDREMRLAATGRAAEHGAAPLTDELGPQEAAEHLEADRGLEGEVELLDRAQEGELGLAHGACDADLGPVGDFLGTEDLEEDSVAHALLLGTQGEIAVEAPDGGEVQALEHGVEIGRAHV